MGMVFNKATEKKREREDELTPWGRQGEDDRGPRHVSVSLPGCWLPGMIPAVFVRPDLSSSLGK